MAEQNVTLAPGESKTVSFEVTPQVVGTYQVSVDGLTGSFRAMRAPVEDDVRMFLRNPSATATHWVWVLRYPPQGLLQGSIIAPVDEVACTKHYRARVPSTLIRVRVLYQEEGQWVSEGDWNGEIPISEYGNYEFDWNTKTLTRIG